MAQIYNDYIANPGYINDGKTLIMDKPIGRTKAVPVDSTSLWSSREAAEAYLTKGTSYIGQILSILEDNVVKAYIIDADAKREYTQGNDTIITYTKKLTELGSGAGQGTITVSDATGLLQTPYEVGQMLYLTTDFEGYTSGVYVVTVKGNETVQNTVIKLAQGSASGDLSNDVANLMISVGSLETAVADIQTTLEDHAEAIEAVNTRIDTISQFGGYFVVDELEYEVKPIDGLNAPSAVKSGDDYFLVAADHKVSTKMVDSKTIYLVRDNSDDTAVEGEAADIYVEYIWAEFKSLVPDGEEMVEQSIYSFERLGNTKLDLKGYIKDTDYATTSTAGIVRPDSDTIYVKESGVIYIDVLTNDEIINLLN